MVAASCGGGSGAGHQSPEAAVRGFVAALQANDLEGAVQWVAPSERDGFRSEVQQLTSSGLRFTFQVRNFDVLSTRMVGPDHAVVRVRGDLLLCSRGTLVGQPFSTCEPESVSPTRAGDTVDVVKEQGGWWVSIRSTAPSTP